MRAPSGQTVITVRAEVQRTVAPDRAYLRGEIATLHGTKRAAEEAARAVLGEFTARLAELGGAALTPDRERAPLSWSVRSLRTHEETEYQGKTGREVTTGRHRASYSFAVIVRDFGLLGRITQALAAHDEISVHGVAWTVDDDNAAWALTRADAVREVLRRGRHYADALGGMVTGVAQIADAGMLAEGRRTERPFVAFAARGAPARNVDDDESSLDPVPQVLVATIDAQLLAFVPAPE